MFLIKSGIDIVALQETCEFALLQIALLRLEDMLKTLATIDIKDEPLKFSIYAVTEVS